MKQPTIKQLEKLIRSWRISSELHSECEPKQAATYRDCADDLEELLNPPVPRTEASK